MTEGSESDRPRFRTLRSRVRESGSRTARIARWEVSRSAGTVDRKTVLLIVGILLVVGVVGLSVAENGLGLDEEIYVVGVDEKSPYHAVAVESDQFRAVALEDVETRGGDANVDVVVTSTEDGTAVGRDGGDVELAVSGASRVTLRPYGETGSAAASAFRDAIDAYNEAQMAREDDRAAAYPVVVSIEYQDRSIDRGGADGETEPTEDGAGNDATSTTGDGASGGTTTDTGDGSTTGSGAGDGGSGGFRVPDVGDGAIGGDPMTGTPGAISPPFPFQSLVLAFLFVVPMNFVIQTYGSTIMDERIKRRGELLLVSPASRREIVAGKTAPYLLGLAAIVVAIASAVEGGGPLSIAAALPIALLFLSATFVGAMLARSFKELTFVTVTISVFLTTYTFIPAIFTDVTPIALISPLTLVVMDLQGESATIGEYLFSTGPFYCSAAVCFLLGIGIYREEDMFAQKPIPAKVLDAIASRIRGPQSVPLLSILFIPFVFAAQLLAVAVLFAVPDAVALPVVIVAAAAIEEFAKSVHVYAGFARSRFEASIQAAAVVGALSGAGFFLGEKLTHVVQIVGLPDLAIGAAAFGPGLSASLPALVALFLAPLILHVVTAVLSAIAASRGRTAYAIGFLAATLVHATYNVGVILLVA